MLEAVISLFERSGSIVGLKTPWASAGTHGIDIGPRVDSLLWETAFPKVPSLSCACHNWWPHVWRMPH